MVGRAARSEAVGRVCKRVVVMCFALLGFVWFCCLGFLLGLRGLGSSIGNEVWDVRAIVFRSQLGDGVIPGDIQRIFPSDVAFPVSFCGGCEFITHDIVLWDNPAVEFESR